MALNQRYLQELSDRFVYNLRHSDYYQRMSDLERENLDQRLQTDAEKGSYPLIPEVVEDDLENLMDAIEEELNIKLPTAVVEILRQVDGFTSNGVTLYGVDPELREDQFDCGPGILTENKLKWLSFPDTAPKFLFLGDSDLWYFALELTTERAVALDSWTLRSAHYFQNTEEMVNDMFRIAIGEIEEHPTEPQEESPGSQFSKN